MSTSITADLTEEARLARMEELVSFLTSGKIQNSFIEEVEDDLTFANCKAARDAANEAVDIDDPGTRLAANYAGALYRDAKYAYAGRHFLLKLGYHNSFRELYEGGKIGIDNEEAWEDDLA